MPDGIGELDCRIASLGVGVAARKRDARFTFARPLRLRNGAASIDTKASAATVSIRSDMIVPGAAEKGREYKARRASPGRGYREGPLSRSST